MLDHPRINVGQVEGALYLNVNARGTQRVCPTAAMITTEYLRANPERPRVIVDLEGADWVDSTFAGWLASLKKKIARQNGALTLIRCSPRCRETFDRMQLGGFFVFADAAPPGEIQCVHCAAHERPDEATTRLMLQAHEELAAVSPENERIFGPIVQALREQLQSK